jgi:transposase
MKYCKISDDKRQMICELVDTGQMTRSEVSNFLHIPYRTVCNIYRRFCDTGEVPERQKPAGRPKILDEQDSHCIQEWLAEDCTLTLKEIKQRFREQKGVEVSRATIHRYLQKFNYSVKRLKLVVESVHEECMTRSVWTCAEGMCTIVWLAGWPMRDPWKL